MKFFNAVIVTAVFFALLAVNPSCNNEKETVEINNGEDEFSFLFMCDIHLRPNVGALKGFGLAIDTANKLDADFVVTGGDLVYDALGVGLSRADSLFSLYKKTTARFNKPVYNTPGNHDLFGIYPESGVDKAHPDYKYGMYKRYLGNPYYSFDHKGWHFIVLSSIDEKEGKYYGVINEEQRIWLEQDLKKLKPETPLAVVVHIPFLSTYYQRYVRGLNPRSPEGAFITNRNAILNMFDKYNLKLVLQGHTHWIEDILIKDRTRFITGGSISGHSWRGNKDVEKGFMKITLRGEEIVWKYINYGWKEEYANE